MLSSYCGISNLKRNRLILYKSDNQVSKIDEFWKQFGQLAKIKSVKQGVFAITHKIFETNSSFHVK